MLAYKATPSTNVGAASSSKGGVKAKMIGVGTFTQWAFSSSSTYPVPGTEHKHFAGKTKSECLAECDQDMDCVLVHMPSASWSGDNDGSGDCHLRSTGLNNNRRSLTRAMLGRLVSSATGTLLPEQPDLPPIVSLLGAALQS